MEILRIKALKKYYENKDIIVKAVDEINLTVNKGEFIAIVGASGSGKTTLLHLLAGLITPTSGEIFVANNNIHQLKKNDLVKFRRHNIGIIYQFYNLISSLNVRDNILLPLTLDGKSIDESKLNGLIYLLGLKDRITFLPEQLSGGQMQRVAIGRALINNPAIILADEPTGNLDSKSKKDIISLLETANKKYNQTIILVTHDEEMALYADRILHMKDGKLK